MKNTYLDVVDQTFYFPRDGFALNNNKLTFHDIDLTSLIEKYGTPFKLTYLPKIGSQIRKARALFDKAINELDFKGKYVYAYCTKSSHWSHVLYETLKNGVQLETSSTFDIDLIRSLYKKGKLDKNITIINNGFKDLSYIKKIAGLIDDGFTNVIPIIDNKDELDLLLSHIKTEKFSIGIRMATEEEPKFEFYTSRLGIRQSEVLSFYADKIAKNPRVNLKMLHFFVDTGIKDDIYYWSELGKGIRTYAYLKKLCPSLEAINIGGGMPISNSLGFEYDYEYMIREIVRNIKEACLEENIQDPDIYTEFGKYTVGESGAIVFSVIGQKQQNDSELWYMIDNSLINTLPDAWAINERFILLPINQWEREYRRVNIGGLSCDNSDYYNSEAHSNQVYLPKFEKNEKLYLGFFHCGAYQDSLSGYGGIKHCLIPSPQHILIDIDDDGNLVDRKIADAQTPEKMLSILGYEL